MENVLSAVFLLISSFAAFGISRYDPSSHAATFGYMYHDRISLNGSESKQNNDAISSSTTPPLTTGNDKNTTILTLIPPPTLFILALSTYTLCTLYTHHLHRRHRYQNYFLTLGFCAGVLIASFDTAANDTTNGLFIGETPIQPFLMMLAASLRTYVPWTVLAASASSAIVHFFVGRRGGWIVDEDEGGHDEHEKMEEKVDEKIEQESGDVGAPVGRI